MPGAPKRPGWLRQSCWQGPAGSLLPAERCRGLPPLRRSVEARTGMILWGQAQALWELSAHIGRARAPGAMLRAVLRETGRLAGKGCADIWPRSPPAERGASSLHDSEGAGQSQQAHPTLPPPPCCALPSCPLPCTGSETHEEVGSVVRPGLPILLRTAGSHLLNRGSIAWNSVFQQSCPPRSAQGAHDNGSWPQTPAAHMPALQSEG